jgi:hypothetical protein
MGEVYIIEKIGCDAVSDRSQQECDEAADGSLHYTFKREWDGDEAI